MNDTKTVSGNIVHIEDGSEAPVLSLKVAITPKQSGTGTPSPDNVRTISGWESVQTSVSGKNVYSGESNIIIDRPLERGTTLYTQVFEGTFSNATLYAKTPTNEWVGIDNFSQFKHTLTINRDDILEIKISNSAYSDLNNAGSHLMVSFTDFDTYEPYTGTTATVNLGRTVYGGTLDVVSGALTDKMGMIDLGDINWRQIGSTSVFYASPAYSSVVGTIKCDSTSRGFVANAVCSQYAVVSRNAMDSSNNCVAINKSDTTYISVKDSRYTDATAFKTAMSGVKFCYELATPQTYTLTPTQVNTLLGENNVWADAGAILEMTYRTEMLGIFGKIMIDGRPYFRPNNFELKREDVYAGEYTTCTGKLIADKIGWKFSDLAMKWDILPDDDLLYLSTLTGTFDIIFRDSDGQHTETVIRKGFTNTPTRITGPDGTAIWTGVEMEVTFINVHNN